jgi:hypothetical protein
MISQQSTRTIILSADDRPFPVVFEMGGQVVVVPAGDHLRLVLRGPADQMLTIGHGSNGISIFREEALEVEVFDSAGVSIPVSGFA